jgi:hypothetical protein
MKKLLAFVLMAVGMASAQTSHTLPTLDRNNNWTGINTFIYNSLRLNQGASCITGQYMSGFTSFFNPICSVPAGGGGGNIVSINGDTTPAQLIVGTGGITCSTTSGTTTCNYAGSAGTGNVGTGSAYQLGAYPAAGTTIDGAPHLFALNPAMSTTLINTLISSLTPGSDTIIIPDGTPQQQWSNTGGVQMIDFRQGAALANLATYGIACDAQTLSYSITSGSNTMNVGSSLSAADIGETLTMSLQTGYGVNQVQSTWAPTITGYTYPNITLSSNAPFSFSGPFVVGHDNTTQMQAAINASGYVFPLQVPTGCFILTRTLNMASGPSLIGQQMIIGGLIGFPGQDILQLPPSYGGGVAGQRLENISLSVDAGIDATRPYTSYNAAGSSTVIQPFNRPLDTQAQDSNNPLAIGWAKNATNGIASITQNSSVICVPNGLGRVPVIGQQILFRDTTAVFQSTIVSNTGGGCAAGYNGSTMAAAFPNTSGYTKAQTEWVSTTSVQNTSTSISGSPTYPFTITLNNSIAPDPSVENNVASHGHIKIGSTEFSYLGSTSVSPYQIVIRDGPTMVNGGAGYSGTNAVIPMNPCPAAFETPWPVIPNLNSGDSTPHGAAYFAGLCGGNAAISYPQPNGLTWAGAGPVNSFFNNLYISFPNQFGSDVTGQNTNNTIGIYEAGNAAGYDTTINQLNVEGLQYGFVQGPASVGQHGVFLAGPTGTGNSITNCTIHAAYPIRLADFQQSNIDRCDTYVTAINPYDGSVMGGSTWLEATGTLDEQTGTFATLVAQDTFKDVNAEPENGNLDEIPVTAELDCINCNYQQVNSEGGFNIMGGSYQRFIGGQLSNPVINYGANNLIEGSTATAQKYITNTWNPTVTSFYNWGTGTSCGAPNGSSGPGVICGVGMVQTYNGQSADTIQMGQFTHPIANPLGGMIVPGEWNTNGSLDSHPMTTGFTVDSTEPFWGSYASCNFAVTTNCQPNSYDGLNGLIWIGPHNRIADTSYVLQLDLRMATVSSELTTIVIGAEDDGTGTCTSPSATVATANYTITNTWAQYYLPVNFATHAGCYFSLQFGPSYNTPDTLRVGAANLVPVPQWALLPVTTPSGACPVSGAILGSDSSNLYVCVAGVVQNLPFGGGGGGGGGAFSAITSGVNSMATMIVNTGASLTTSGSGTITATGMPYSGLTGSVPTWNQSTTGTSAGLTGSPAITVSNVTDSALTPGDCVQATTGGLLATTGAACGSGGGSGPTVQTNSVNNISQTTLNFTNTASVLWSNPSLGVEEATVPTATNSVLGVSSPDNVSISVGSGVYSIIKPANNTVIGFGSGGGYTGFTAGANISFAGNQISSTGGISGTISTTNCLIKQTGASTVTCSLATDNGTSFTYPGTGGIVLTGTTPGLVEYTAGTGTVASLPANSYGFVGPLTGGTPYLIQMPATITGGAMVFAAPATGYGVNVSEVTVEHIPHEISTGFGTIGELGNNVVLASTKALNSGKFTNLQVVYGGGPACTQGESFIVFDGTTLGTATVTNSTTYQAPGTATNTAQTLTFSAGDNIGIATAGTVGNCAGYMTVTAQYQDP